MIFISDLSTNIGIWRCCVLCALGPWLSYSFPNPPLVPRPFQVAHRSSSFHCPLPQGGFSGPLSGIPTFSFPCHSLPRPEKKGAATGVDAVCTYHPDPAGPKLDREKLYWELSQQTHGVTQLGSFTLDKNSLYVNGEQPFCNHELKQRICPQERMWTLHLSLEPVVCIISQGPP